MHQQMFSKVIFWGATGQAKVLREGVEKSGLELIALFDNNKDLKPPFDDVPLYHGTKGFEEWKKNVSVTVGFLVAIGGERGEDRVLIQQYLEEQGLISFVTIHPTAYVADNVVIDMGSQVLANSTICVETKIGRGCIINTGAIVDHECYLGDGVHIGPGVNLAGCVTVENYATIYTGAIILPRIQIGHNAIVGAGAVVTKDVLPHSVVVGNPAKVSKRKR